MDTNSRSNKMDNQILIFSIPIQKLLKFHDTTKWNLNMHEIPGKNDSIYKLLDVISELHSACSGPALLLSTAPKA